MASAAGESGAGGGDRCPSGVGCPYLEKEYRECVVRGEESPFDLEDLLRRYGSSPPNPEVPAPPSSSGPARNPSEHSAFPRKDG